MCLIALAWQQHADFPLVVVANRDEFFNRPTAAADWWADPAGLYAGRDLQAGGTWLGVSRSGRFAALTNFRDPARLRPQVRSRGELVVQALASEATAMRFGQLISARRREYNPFNLIAYDGAELVAVEAEAERTSALPAGIYGLSNHLLNTPWPKVRLARQRLERALDVLPDGEKLLGVLRDDRPAADADLPETGMPETWERMLSSCFIRAPGYGTRCTSVVLIGRDGSCHFIEQRWNALGAAEGRSEVRFTAEH